MDVCVYVAYAGRANPHNTAQLRISDLVLNANQWKITEDFEKVICTSFFFSIDHGTFNYSLKAYRRSMLNCEKKVEGFEKAISTRYLEVWTTVQLIRLEKAYDRWMLICEK